MTETPLVSVVMPCYNGQDYLAEAIESILQQSYQNFELIVVDDNSSDESGAIIKKYVGDIVRVIHHDKNMGISRSLNDGIRAARGEFIARMDADDISGSRRLQEQMEIMLSDDDVAVVGTGVNVVDQEGSLIYCHRNPVEDVEIRKLFASTFPVWSGSQMWRKTKLYEAGLFDERIPSAEDLELTLRLCLTGTARNVISPLYTYRKNTSGEVTISSMSLVKRISLARKAFALKRENDYTALDDLYQDAIDHYQKTRFTKGSQVPSDNRYHYYVTIALTCLVKNNKRGAKAYFDKAKRLKPKAFTNLALAVLLRAPPSVISFAHKVNRVIKKYLYMFYAGNVVRYLDRAKRIGR